MNDQDIVAMVLGHRTETLLCLSLRKRPLCTCETQSKHVRGAQRACTLANVFGSGEAWGGIDPAKPGGHVSHPLAFSYFYVKG